MGKSHRAHPPLSAGVVVMGGGEPPIKSSKRERTGPQLLEGAAWKDGVSFFREVGGNFHMKNKIKSDVFDNKNG